MLTVVDRRNNIAAGKMRIATINTPIDALQGIDLEHYDAVMAEITVRRVKEIEKAQEIVAELERRVQPVLDRWAEPEARDVLTESRRIAEAERLMRDGVAFDIQALQDEYVARQELLLRFGRLTNKVATTLHTGLKRLHGKSAARGYQFMTELSRRVKQLASQYQLFTRRAKALTQRSECLPPGRIAVAFALYKEAFQSIEGVQFIGNIEAHLYDGSPVYELPVDVDPRLLADRKQLRAIEQSAHDWVEERNPEVVGVCLEIRDHGQCCVKIFFFLRKNWLTILTLQKRVVVLLLIWPITPYTV